MPTGILLTAFGGPSSLEEIGPFMERLMGRAPSPDLLEEIRLRYLTIGGASPLPDLANRIAGKLSESLDHTVPIAVGMRYSPPFIGDALAALAKEADRILHISLSPLESEVSTAAYREAIAEARRDLGDVEVVETDPYIYAPEFVSVLAASCGDAIEELGHYAPKAKSCVVFTAHSLPVEETGGGEYVRQLRDLVRAVAEEAMLEGPAAAGQTWLQGIDAFGSGRSEMPWLIAYQSKGRRPGEWLGPAAADVVNALSSAGIEGVAVCPVGFVTEHMETLYDLDVELAGQAMDLGVEFTRGWAPNDHPLMIDALRRIVVSHL